MAGANDFAFKRHVHKKFRHFASGAADGRIAGTYNTDTAEQTDCVVHLQAKIGDVDSDDLSENLDQSLIHVIGQLEHRFVMPARGNAFEILRREFPLEPVGKGEVKMGRLVSFAMTHRYTGFPRVVVAVMAEKNNLASDLFLQPAGGADLRNEVSLREEPTWLLAKANDRFGTHAADDLPADLPTGPIAA